VEVPRRYAVAKGLAVGARRRVPSTSP
jgi:hypothetical protein